MSEIMLSQINLHEWETKSYRDTPELRGLFLPPNLQSKLEKLEGMITISELREGLSIETSSFVGRILLGNLQLTIQPKIATDTLMYLLRYAYNLRDLLLMESHSQATEHLAFQDILIIQLLAEINELWSRGLKRNYLRHDESLPSPKGRLNIQEIAQQGGIREAALPVIHYPRSQNVVLNQVLLGGLYLSANLTSDLVLRTKARRLARLLGEEIKILPLSNHLLDEACRLLNRLTRAYEPALTLIRLLMDGQGISLEDNQSLPLKGFLFDMNRFWENLLLRFLRENLPNYTVYDQARLKGMMTYARGYNPKPRKAPVPRPDYLVMRDGELTAMLDAKYRDIWNKGLPRDMLYQLGIYALSQGNQGKSTILYPATSENAAMEIIEIHDVLTQSYQASIRLQPVSLNRLREVLATTGYKGELARQEFAMSLVLPST